MKQWLFILLSMLATNMASALVLPKHTIHLAFCSDENFEEVSGLSAQQWKQSLHLFYKANQYNNLWQRTDLVDEFYTMLMDLPAFGLDTQKYQLQLMQSFIRSTNLSDKVQLEFLLSSSYLTYYNTHLNGIVPYSERDGRFYYSNPPMDTLGALMQLLLTKDASVAQQTVSNFQVPILRETTKNYYQIMQAGGWVQVKGNIEDSLSFNDRDTVVAQLRARLFQSKDLKNPHKLRSPILDKEVSEALKNFQQRFRIDTTGILDENTLIQLNSPIEKEWEALIVNLERWRWMPKEMGDFYLETNIPSYLLQVYETDSVVMTKKTVVGKKSRATPAFHSTMSYLEINPTWTVPPTILAEDIVPSASKNSSYLDKKNIRVYDVGSGQYISNDSINWGSVKTYKFIQKPSASNSLGTVKFIFPNSYYIFIHDTPTKYHFNYKERAYSSGCMRLEEPRELAHFLLEKQGFSVAEVDSIFDAGNTKRITIQNPPEVYVTYFTVTADKVGNINYFNDPYDYDEDHLKFFKTNKN